MSTAAQIAANQANAGQSTGPRTEQGKATVSQNPIKHGLTGHAAFIKGEDPEEYRNHIFKYLTEHKSETMDEEFLLKQMADAMWRLRRARQCELDLLNRAPGGSPSNDPQISIELARLNRYEKSIESSYYRASRELRAMRKEKADEIRNEEQKRLVEAKAEHKLRGEELTATLDALINAPLPDFDFDEYRAKQSQSGGEKIPVPVSRR